MPADVFAFAAAVAGDVDFAAFGFAFSAFSAFAFSLCRFFARAYAGLGFDGGAG